METKLLVLNEYNIYINKKIINDIFKKYKLRHRVINLEQYQLAMTHESYQEYTDITQKMNSLMKDAEPINDPDDALPLQKDSYGRLEYLGDAVIHQVIAEYLFTRYPDKREGFLTSLRAKIEQTSSLSFITKRLGLEKYILLGRYMEKRRNTDEKLTEDIFESFIGALSLESNYNICKKFIINIIEEEIDIASLIYNDCNYKGQLSKYYQKMNWKTPVYEDEVADLENKVFTVFVRDNDKNVIAKATCNTKIKATLEVARMALEYFNVCRMIPNEGEEVYEIL